MSESERIKNIEGAVVKMIVEVDVLNSRLDDVVGAIDDHEARVSELEYNSVEPSVVVSEPDPDVAKQRWFDGTHTRPSEGGICSGFYNTTSARVFVSRANALRGVGRPEKVPELLRLLKEWPLSGATEKDFGLWWDELAEAFDAIAYEPPEDGE